MSAFDHVPLASALTPEAVDVLLQDTSRTFALAVPLLSGRTRLAVGLAYLLFRCADTLEDASSWTPAQRKGALAAFADLLAPVAPPLTEARRLADEWIASGVSELLTALFVLDEPKLESVRAELVTEERSFGEGLQLSHGRRESAE